MTYVIWIAIALVAVVLLTSGSGSLSQTLQEGFLTQPRSDIGPLSEGWTEEAGYDRDLRYSETFTDIQGLGIAADFCRAVKRTGDTKGDTTHIACALGRRDGMDTMEYRSPAIREGFRMSRDDYWRRNPTSRRMDYGRILRDRHTGEFFAAVAIAGPDGFKSTEEHDTAPPSSIKTLLDAYDGILAWYRWVDDAEDYAENTALSVRGHPTFPSLLKPDATRGLELNRWTPAAQAATEPPAAPADRDALRWGEPGTLVLDHPGRIRAFSFWVYWDTFQGSPAPTILDFSTDGARKNRVWFGIEGGAADLPPPPRPIVQPAAEVTPQQLTAICPEPEPYRATRPLTGAPASRDVATYVFEIWDEEQRVMRLAAPFTARTGTWQHIVLTTTDSTTYWPTWQLYVDGALVATRTEGRAIPALELTHNFIGRGFRGCLVDFRVYTKPMPAEKRTAAMEWAKPRLHPVP
jgi:hypothetical protein